MTNRALRRLAGAAVGSAAVCVALASVANMVHGLPRGPRLTVAARPVSDAVLGAYTGPSAKGAAALTAWHRWSGTRAPYALDFAAGDSWANITGPDWLLDPWQAAGRRLIYSMPMFPHRPGDSARVHGARLAACAAGRYDARWAELGRRLVARRMATTIVRPGWEFDGSWYPWSALGRERQHMNCFRHVVTAMRRVPGQRFQFLWNPGIGVQRFPAERAYPGDRYVDLIGVDVYDTSWTPGSYPGPAAATREQRHALAAAVWSRVRDGDHGLRFWARYAAAHGKPLAVPEWGLSARADGHGGLDNPLFIEEMVRFVRDPRNGVAFAMYFDADSAHGDRHRISTPDSRFPLSRAVFRRLLEVPQ
ncbi:glycoside hydrolase family 26 protein [Actinoplanes sp. NPDC049599]|uniref:glycoside hydrolase family 26 protein n=1 Tax=Actinoplanes sp. NPDC049599 TaxID=3363903 RepID=UPI0037BD0EEB